MARIRRKDTKVIALCANSFCIIGAILIAAKWPVSGLIVSFFGNIFMFGYGYYMRHYSFCWRAAVLMVIYALGAVNWR